MNENGWKLEVATLISFGNEFVFSGFLSFSVSISTQRVTLFCIRPEENTKKNLWVLLIVAEIKLKCK